MGIQIKQRVEYIDALKGFAIFCVLWGHSLQHLRNGYNFFDNQMFEFIYSFHMPLFFLISGFFFRSSIKMNLKDFLLKKSVQLVLPCVVWALIYYINSFSTAILNQDKPFLSNWLIELKNVLNPINWIWFLKELFISYFIIFVLLKLLKKEWLAFLVSISFVLIAPLCNKQRVLLPLFWLGIYMKDNYQFLSKYAKQILIISGIFFAICLLFWNGNYTMYVIGFPKLLNIKTLSFDFSNMDISLFRLFIGICGSLFWFTLFETKYKKNIFFDYLSKIGANTLAIYVLQRLILEEWINRIIDFPKMNIWAYNLIVTPMISLVILIICNFLIKIVKKNRYVELLLFGKNEYKEITVNK